MIVAIQRKEDMTSHYGDDKHALNEQYISFSRRCFVGKVVIVAVGFGLSGSHVTSQLKLVLNSRLV